MSDNTYQPVKIWTWEKSNGGTLANINRPISGATREETLPVDRHLLQLYSLGTPNGQKMTIMLEELLAQGVKGAGHDAWIIHIGGGDQLPSGFVGVNPSSKIPTLRDRSQNPPVRVFESGAVLLYLAKKYGYFLPQNLAKRTETLNWLFWLQGTVPFLDGGFSHFYSCASIKIKYAINRFTMETKRLLDVLDKQLAQNQFVTGDEYTIADMAAWSRLSNVMLDNVYDAVEFLDAGGCKHVQRWTKEVTARPAVKRGRIVDRINGPLNEQLHECYDASDFDTNTKDKRQG